MSISNNEFPQDADESDSEINLDDNPDYYQPISSDDEDENDSDPNLGIQILSNGHSEPEISEEEEEEEEEEEIEGATNSEISRAFKEDENRRKAPLTPESSNRIMDAMRGISLQGFVPDWSNKVPESNWIDHLRNLRLQQQQPLSSSANTGAKES
ncbi:protein rpi-1-like isoform X2 [Papaver somniferum]|uniref:protein rpi-1-like isoform X2 n=1 Tax=Papaver somniferum TaxID=3469 RepID=UPI000E6F4ED2|nr:protein rpi-1-like isoform X2 [Papaver somniferum]